MPAGWQANAATAHSQLGQCKPLTVPPQPRLSNTVNKRQEAEVLLTKSALLALQVGDCPLF